MSDIFEEAKRQFIQQRKEIAKEVQYQRGWAYSCQYCGKWVMIGDENKHEIMCNSNVIDGTWQDPIKELMEGE